VALVLLGVAGCGGSSSDPETVASGEGYVSAKRLSGYERGTPQRTFMEWWKAVQFGNPTLVHSYYAPGMGPSLPRLQSELATASNQFVAIPEFDSTEIHGKTATLYVLAARPGSDAPPRAYSANLAKDGGAWGLADDELLAQVVERVKNASQPVGGG
jgi:hypothetical protein